MKLRYRIPIGLVVGLVILCIGVMLYLDDLVKSAVEDAGEEMMGVSTSVDSLHVRPFIAGNLNVRGLTIGNPDGFDTPHFMKIDRADVTFSIGDLMAETAEIDSITIDALNVNLEKGEDGANYRVVLENMRAAGERDPQDDGGKRFVIREIVIRNITVRAEFGTRRTKLSHVDLTIAEIRLRDVGADSDRGAAMSQVMGTIVKATLAAAVKQGHRILPEMMLNGLGLGLRGLGKLGVGTIRVVGTVGGRAMKIVVGGVEAVGEGVEDILEGIFGGEDEKED